jgi:hypothetical protein
MTDKQKILASARLLLSFGHSDAAKRLWREWKQSSEIVYAPAEAETEREHREKMAF